MLELSRSPRQNLQYNSVMELLTFATQNTREAAGAIKNMHIRRATRYLKDVVDKKQIIPFRRYSGGVGRKAQVSTMCLIYSFLHFFVLFIACP